MQLFSGCVWGYECEWKFLLSLCDIIEVIVRIFGLSDWLDILTSKEADF